MNELLELGLQMETLKEQKRAIEYQLDTLKEQVAKHLVSEGRGQIVVPGVDGLHEFVFKSNLRFTKSFDKNGLAAKTGRDREELDYHGVSALVEKRVFTSELVGEHLSERKSQFVSVSRRKAKVKR